ncbi:kinesin-like protein KIF11 [Austrofundulus limnaeus]|uniref:Kinesin-like protein KIF11 n=1 Tax=Austrofundulus limnaeus TaxID=52670 RepID=A0A2I4CT00_AUSLI|nr:PREDICTED: kinesin-like protein KIF11 [Austrofundulus limnaeus]
MEVQQGFAQRMDGAFSNMQRSVEQCGVKHNNILSGYSQAVDGLLVLNEAALKDSLTNMESFVGGVRSLVTEGVARCQEKVQQHKALCPKNKEILLQLLEEHQQDMESVLAVRTLRGLSVVRELSDSLQSSVEKQRALVQKVEEMKEIGVFLSSLVQELANLREAHGQGVSALQAKHNKLEVDILQAKERHQLGMKQTIQCLQDQLTLQTLQTLQDYTDLHSSTKDLKSPALSLKQGISSGCSSVENQVSAQADLLASTSSSLTSSLRLTADESQQALSELNGYCSDLHSSVSGLVERDLQWQLGVREHVDNQTQKHLSMMETVSAETQSLSQSVETCCTELLQQADQQLSTRQEEVKQAHTAVLNQTSVDWTVLEQQKQELEDHIEKSQQMVHTFLRDELQQDVPTGATPQRREFVYPRQLHKARRRSELLDSLRRQQEELQAALKEEEEQEEEPEPEEVEQNQTDPDSVEDDTSNYNSEPSFNENLVFNERKRLPFFKQKKGSKDSKTSRSKTSGNNVPTSPQKPRLPLRPMN